MKKSELFAYAQKWAGGITKHTAALQLVRYPAPELLSHLGNSRQTELEFQVARSVTLEASNQSFAARSLAVLFIEKARTVLKPYLGERWSTAWNQAGFTRNSLQIPDTNTAAVVDIVRTLQVYFTAHPTHQNAATGVTAAASAPLVTSLDSTTTALNNAKSGQRLKREARDTTHNDLSKYLKSSRKEVESAMTKDDARWLDFVDAVPGDLRAPEVVSALVAQPGLPGHVHLGWLPSLRASAYGIEIAIGPDGEFEHFVTVHDTVADLELTPGAVVRIRLKASNAAGQSAPSAVAEVTVPVAAAA
jgi:hypothetical protein